PLRVAQAAEPAVDTIPGLDSAGYNDGVFHPDLDQPQAIQAAYGTKYDPSKPGWHDYLISNVVIPAELHYTPAQALALFRKFAVPGNDGTTVISGHRYLVTDPFTGAPAGLVVSTITNNGYTITNETVPGLHILEDGEIVRTLRRNPDGSWSVDTHGFGNNKLWGMATLNKLYGPVVFDELDYEM